jgi:protein TonB
VTTVQGTADSNSAAPVAAGSGAGTVVGAPTKVEVADAPPPPPPPAPKAPISGGVLNGKAISLPKPAYPAIAKQAHASGTVVVQVTIDENGGVISAHAVSGHPLLQAVCVSAARQARFSPTKLSGQPVKVTGVITYNFVAQ